MLLPSQVLGAKGLVKRYARGDTTVEALRGVDLNVQRGDFSALAGPSGSGKSTLLHLVGLLETPSEGEIWLEDKLVSNSSATELDLLRRRHIGFVFQSFNLVPVLSARENVELPLLMEEITAQQRRERADRLLGAVGLEGRFDHRPGQLSGGQQQRVAIARALINEPLLVLADEPTANLDSDTAGRLLDVMQQLSVQLGTAFLVSTHDPRVVERAGRVIKLSDGRLAS